VKLEEQPQLRQLERLVVSLIELSFALQPMLSPLWLMPMMVRLL
jgi:hypothetical protein